MLGAQIISNRRSEMAGAFPYLVQVVGAPFVIPTYHRKLPRTESFEALMFRKKGLQLEYGGCGNRGLHTAGPLTNTTRISIG